MWANDVDTSDYAAAPRRPRGRPARAHDPRAARPMTSMADVGRGRILGIETSCDETAAAIVEGGTSVLSSVVTSQVDLHARYGGVVPEIASRAHVDLIVPVVAQAFVEAGLSDRAVDGAGCEVDAVAATYGPGLVGALLVGVSAAKALALAWDVPFVAVNHLEAHLYAALLEEPDLELPLVVLLVSGGHTMLVHMEDHGQYTVLGSTIDDAAGEAFDKVARFLGLGYPGGPAIDALARRRRSRGHPVPAPHARRRHLRLLVQRPEDGGRQPRPQAPGRVHRRRGGVVPGGGGRRARHQGPGGRPSRWAPRACASAGAWPPTRGCASGSSRPAWPTASAGSCPAGPCAPTTPPWSPARPGTAGACDGPQPLDTGAFPNLGITAEPSR